MKIDRHSPVRPDAPGPAGARLGAANRAWRHHIVSHAGGLRPAVDAAHDHVRGPGDAAVTLVEYGDYQSPDCVTAAPPLQELCRRFDGRLRFAFRHFPIGDAHPFALRAAEAAEAAGAQGRFWEMHDRLYGRTRDLDRALLRTLATELDLDLARFDAELADQTHLRHVLEDFQSGVDSGVNGAPTLFIDGQRLDGDRDPATIEAAVERAVVRASAAG